VSRASLALPWAAALAVVLSSAGARAQEAGAAARAVCGDPRYADRGPLPGGTDAADFGAIPESCGGTDLAMRLRASALIASSKPDFFGDVIATSTLRLRYPIGRSTWTWLSVAADLLTFRYVVNGPVESQGFAVGPPTIALHRALGDWPLLAATAYARLLLPVDSARETGARTGFELGVTGRRVLGARARWGVQGGAALLAPVVFIGGATHAALQPVALVEGWFAPRPSVALTVGASAKAEVSPDPTFLTLAPRVAARFAFRHGLSFSMLFEAPAAGEDRTNVIAGFFLAWAAGD
jgi:hypothetical protein